MPCSSQIFLLENPNLESQPVQQRGCLTRIWTYGWNYSTHLNVYRLWEIRDENSASFRELVSRFVLVFTNTNTSIFLFDTVHLFFNVLGAQKRRDKLVKGYEQRTNRTKWTNIHTRTLITYPGVSANVTRESIGGRGRGDTASCHCYCMTSLLSIWNKNRRSHVSCSDSPRVFHDRIRSSRHGLYCLLRP